MLKIQDTPLLVENFMSPCVMTVAPETSLTALIDILHTKNFRHLPVIDKGSPIGVISERDLRIFMSVGYANNFSAKDIMTVVPFIVKHTSEIKEVLDTMIERKYGSAIVVDGVGKVCGIFTTTDAMKVLRMIVA